MTENFDRCLAHVLKSEGGYVNHPADPGGRTNLGVTQRVWEEWVKRPVTEQEMRDLKPEDVKELYRQRYWNQVKCNDLPTGVDLCAFDFAVNSGVRRATTFLQRMVGAKEDGIIGPRTLAAVKAEEQDTLIRRYCAARLQFLQGLSTFATFGRGWTARVARVEKDALEMLNES